MTEEPPFDTGRRTGSQVLGLLTGSPEDLSPRRWPRVSRPCYDKLRRCPGWAGGGTRSARVRRCDNGFLRTYDEDGMLPFWRLRFYRCPKCGVLVLPYMTRWLDYRYWGWKRRDLVYRYGELKQAARENFSWWDAETGERAGWAGPREIASRLPLVTGRWARSRVRYWRALRSVRRGR